MAESAITPSRTGVDVMPLGAGAPVASRLRLPYLDNLRAAMIWLGQRLVRIRMRQVE